MNLDVLLPGMMDYETAFDLQLQLIEDRRQNRINDTLILLEHPPVITMSKRATIDQIKVSKDFLFRMGVKIAATNRGGEITYHGPGQMVGYIILNLINHSKDIKRLVFNLEEVFIRLLNEEYQIRSDRDLQHRGVWVGRDKIAALGLAVKQGITMHGFSFNINVDLSYSDWIIPCGIHDRGITSLKKLINQNVEWEKATKQVIDYFSRIFGYTNIQIHKKEGKNICPKST